MTWTLAKRLHVGGTIAAGFTIDARFLLVVCRDGRALFDVNTGDRVARYPDYMQTKKWPRQTEAHGIGPCEGVAVPTIVDLDMRVTWRSTVTRDCLYARRTA